MCLPKFNFIFWIPINFFFDFSCLNSFDISAPSCLLCVNVLLCPQLWQRRWLVLRRASSKAPCRLEKFVDERAARSPASTAKTALLTGVSAVCRVPASVKRHAFTICFVDTTKCFACDSGQLEIRITWKVNEQSSGENSDFHPKVGEIKVVWV